MLQQHPYLNQPENVANKYNKPVNLSQQLSFSKSLPGQGLQPEQNYATPQWQKQMNPQFSNQQPQIQTIQSKYIPQQQTIYQPQTNYVSQTQQQFVPIAYPQQQQFRQSSPPRIFKMNQQPQQQQAIYRQTEVRIPEYYSPPPIQYDEPVFYEQPRYYPPQQQQIKLPPPQIENYFLPNQVSFIRNLDDGLKYPEYPFKALDIRDYFNKALIDMATQEEKIERAKIQVCSQLDFRINGLFNQFDQNQTGQLSKEEFAVGLKAFSLQAEQCDITLLFEEFGYQGMMDIQQFGNMIKPQTDLKNTKAFQDDDVKVLPETKLLIRNLFVTLLNAESVLEGLRQYLISKEEELRQDIEYEQIFEDIFSNDHPNNLRFYLQNQGQYFDMAVINSLFNRFDRECTKRITQDQFTYTFQPKLKKDDNCL
ncbi:unnamed protein product (macronuclear) [Paramecium tetraurelia]|uniref:EF-hand domain-containing protein n=1 Tax=Paramecium tetraurelia TaxID=5888 RepID=A0DS75_PARTE|nr:uncharacterized protein GSPATT00019596001 [Paramecium tetraurelia]CAK85892.1 unnamed protein product [Paramecium tetraurelia]|eukprot:XP_001453289.1 hypothetical protein (macronuclear) [Paramecium tetraurelia strain d4-2]